MLPDVVLILVAHEPPPDSAELYQRLKDRMTYDHQAFRIDLTQVKTQGGPEVRYRESSCKYPDSHTFSPVIGGPRSS